MQNGTKSGTARSGEIWSCQIWRGRRWKVLILACCDAADGALFCVDTRAEGRKMCENKNTLLVRTKESERHIAQLCSSSVIGDKLKSSSATVCPTEADSKYLVETALVLAESLGGDSKLG